VRRGLRALPRGGVRPQRFLRDFSTQAQALVPHEGMFIAWLEDEGRTFSGFVAGRCDARLSRTRFYTLMRRYGLG